MRCDECITSSQTSFFDTVMFVFNSRLSVFKTFFTLLIKTSYSPVLIFIVYFFLKLIFSSLNQNTLASNLFINLGGVFKSDARLPLSTNIGSSRVKPIESPLKYSLSAFGHISKVFTLAFSFDGRKSNSVP